MALPEALKFTISLVDKITRPVAAISDSLRDLRETYTQNAEAMAGGVGAIAASGMAMYGMLAPSIELDRQLNSLKGFDVSQDAMNNLRKAAIDFSNDYAITASSVAEHAVQMRTVLGKMPEDVMIQTAKASALLTAKMGSDAVTVTRYIKNMAGNFKGDLGADEFVDQLTAMTLKSQKLYGINIDEMEGMMSGMHSLTSGLGVSLKEQMSTMGMMSQYMDNGDVTTYYTNFLEGIHEAQEKLKINLMDSEGHLLEMPKIIDKLQDKFKGIKPFELRHILDDAGLGDGSLMLMKLVENAEEFKKKHAELSKVKGLDSMLESAKSNVFIWDKLGVQLGNISTAFGGVLLPAIEPVVQSLSDMAQWITDMTLMFPNISRHIGYATLIILGFGIAGGIFSIASAMLSNFLAVAKLGSFVLPLLSGAFTWLKGAILGVNMMLAANPMVAIIASVVAASAAIGYMIVEWDNLKAKFSDSFFGTLVMTILSPFKLLFEFIKGGWNFVVSGFTDFTAFNSLFSVIEDLKQNFSFLFDSVIEKFEWIKGIGGSVMSWFSGDDTEIEAVQQARPKSTVTQGGIINQMSSAQSKTTNLGGITINTQHMPDPYQFRNTMEMIAG